MLQECFQLAAYIYTCSNYGIQWVRRLDLTVVFAKGIQRGDK